MNTAQITILPPDPLPGLIEQALEILPQLKDGDTREKLACVVARALTQRIEGAMFPSVLETALRSGSQQE